MIDFSILQMFSRGFTHHKDLERSLEWRNVFGKFNVRRGLPPVKKRAFAGHQGCPHEQDSVKNCGIWA